MSVLSMRIPVGSSVGVGLLVSLCCGGSLVFTSVGLGAFYGSLGLFNYVPQVFAVGALSILAINYTLFRRAAAPFGSSGADLRSMHRRMIVGAAIGLVVAAASFLIAEWYDHNVVHPQMLKVQGYGDALLPGVPNIRFLFIAESFAALALLWALPFAGIARTTSRTARRTVTFASVLVLALLVTGGLGPLVDLSGRHDTHGTTTEEHAPAAPAAPHAPASASPSH